MGSSGKVVVLTGASSGIGRAGAVRFAARGALVVLAARRVDELEETARQCRAEGGEAVVVHTDVTREDDVDGLVRAALGLTGRIDVWVNNAGTTLFAPLEAAPFEEHRRVVQTNLFGPMLAARAVVPLFTRQGDGVMINVSSILGKVAQPFVPSYVISKFGLRGMSQALRTELAEYPNVHVCTLLPYAIDTPHFEGGANWVGRRARTMPPVQSPERVADRLVELAEHPRREAHVPRIAVLGLMLHALFPVTCERLIFRLLRHWHFDEVPEPPAKEGGLFAPDPEATGVHGTRPPQIGTPRLVLSAARELVRMATGAGAKPAP